MTFQALCDNITAVVEDLGLRGIVVQPSFLGITQDRDDEPNFPCLTDNVLDRLGGDVPGVKDLLDDAEDWGPGTAIVADGFPWTEGSIRVIVPISDEDPQDGDGCFASDTDAVNNAIAQAKANNVAVSPIVAELGEGNCDSDDCTCIEPLALELAERTGGAMFLSTDPNADLGSAITELVEMVCRLSSDCNGNEIPDACEICPLDGGTAGEPCLFDCNNNGIPDECDGGCE